jgi:hypothetical protein
MNLLITYVLCVVLGQAAVIGVALAADHFYSSSFISLMIFFPLFFGMFWLAWRVSVRLTEPKIT